MLSKDSSADENDNVVITGSVTATDDIQLVCNEAD